MISDKLKRVRLFCHVQEKVKVTEQIKTLLEGLWAHMLKLKNVATIRAALPKEVGVYSNHDAICFSI